MIATLSLMGAMIGHQCTSCVSHQNPVPAPAPATAQPAKTMNLTPTAEQSFRKLIEGNARFVEGMSQFQGTGSERRRQVATGQAPHTIFLSCADSRVPLEILFDQGLGDLFVVRVAGNVADVNSIASIEYAAAVLGSPLLVVLGHERCGAVDAAVKADKDPSGIGTNKEMANIEGLVGQILPSVKAVKSQPGDILDNAIAKNVELTKADISNRSPLLARLIKEGKFSVIGGVYDLDSGRVNFIGAN
jgi:carbonic anhydrase